MLNLPIRTLALMVVGISCVPTQAETFSVATQIFVGDDSVAQANHRVVFDNGLVYDLEDRFVTVYDAAQERITLLDRSTKVQAEVQTAELLQVTAQARAALETPEQKQRNGLLARVESSERVEGFAIRFANAEYNITTQQPSDPSMADDFAEFADMALRLNILRPRGLPPFARMTLNQHLRSAGALPKLTTLTYKQGERTTELRSSHELGPVTDQDRQRIAEIQEMLADFRRVEVREFPQ